MWKYGGARPLLPNFHTSILPTSSLMSDAIRFEHVSKRFGGVQALADVSFGVRKGEVHAVVGENGAGKSTVMKLLAGALRPDGGRILLNDEPVRLTSPLEARRRGISIVFQELSLFPHLTVASNIFVNRELASRGILHRRAMNRAAAEALDSLGLAIDPEAWVAALSIGEKQQVEIARTVSTRADIVILDEPNSALTEAESARLFEVIRRMRDRGVTVIYVSHRLEEVFAISDRITVLRDGRCVGTWNVEDTFIPEIISQMIGRAPSEAFPERRETPESVTILTARDLEMKGRLGPISFEVRLGEIVGFAGLEGAGVETLFRVLFGLERTDSGEVAYSGEIRRLQSPGQAIRQGWGLIPASRRDEGLMMEWSVERNATLLILDKLIRRIGLLDRPKGRRLTGEFVDRLNIATDSVDKPVIRLSGGNQQKVLLAKWLAAGPKVLLLNDPTRGVDVGAKEEIYALIRELADQGLAILLTSSEIEETLGLSDRVLVLSKGRIHREFARGTAHKVDVLHAVSGGSA